MDNDIILKIAQDAIRQRLFFDTKIDKKELIEKYPFLGELKATSIAIYKDSKLRGSSGSLVAQRSLIDDIISNIVNAAFYDDRFKPLVKEEFDSISIEISILSTLKQIKYKNMKDLSKKIKPKRDGVVITYDGKQASFSPQIWEEVEDFNLFMMYLFKQVDIEPAKLKKLPEIYTFTVQKIS